MKAAVVLAVLPFAWLPASGSPLRAPDSSLAVTPADPLPFNDASLESRPEAYRTPGKDKRDLFFTTGAVRDEAPRYITTEFETAPETRDGEDFAAALPTGTGALRAADGAVDENTTGRLLAAIGVLTVAATLLFRPIPVLLQKKASRAVRVRYRAHYRRDRIEQRKMAFD